MRAIAAFLTLLFVCGCAHVEIGASAGATTTVNRVFVERLQSFDAFNYLRFWKIPSVEGLLDAPLRQAFQDYKAAYSRVKLADIPFCFPVYARADPLTMCAAPPGNPIVRKVKGDASSAVYTVTYKQGVDGSIGQYYKIVSTVSLVNHSGQWLVSGVTNSIYDGRTVEVNTFVSRLQKLLQKLKGGQ